MPPPLFYRIIFRSDLARIKFKSDVVTKSSFTLKEIQAGFVQKFKTIYKIIQIWLLILQIIILANSSSFGQCVCNLNFGDSEFSTSIWSQSGIAGNGYVVDKIICIKGTLIIDVDIKFLNCRFKMFKNSSIYISNNNKFNSSHCTYEACESFMWNGIIGTWGSVLEFNNNTINDAKTGIYCYPNTTLKLMIQNKFNRCQFGLYAQSAIVGSPFVGNSYFSNGTMIPPFQGLYPERGMLLINIAGVTERKGRYDHMKIGIELIGTIYQGDKIFIQNGGPLDFSHPPLIFITSFGIAAGNYSDLKLTNSLIRSYPVGVFSGNSNTLVTNDTIRNVLSGILVTENKGLNIDISNNNLDTLSELGIVIQNSTPTLKTRIANNLINFNSFSIYGHPGDLSIGIDIENDVLLDVEQNSEINNNFIFENNLVTPNYFGISLFNVGNLLVTDNTSVFSNPTVMPKYGISTVRSPAINIFNNTMIGGGVNTPNSTGYYIRDSDINLLCCNTSIAVDIGTEFNGTCLDSKISGSNFNGPYISNALLFSFTWTAIQQIYPGNNWIGQSPIDARYIGDPFIASNDNFIVSSVGLPFHPDNPIDGPIDWFIKPLNPDQEYLCLIDPDCNGMPGSNCNDFPNDEYLLTKGYSGLHGEGITWQARKNVLRKMWQDSNFGCNTSLVDSFKIANLNSNLGKLARILNNINNSLALTALEKFTLDSLNILKNQMMWSIYQLDSIWEIDSTYYDYWSAIRISQVNQLSLINQQMVNILNAYHTNNNSQLLDIQVELESINPVNIMEENDLFTTGIFLSKNINEEYILSELQLSSLILTASQCPLDGGEGVSNARAMLNDLMQVTNFISGTCDTFIGARNNNLKVNLVDFSIKPNPNSGNFIIEVVNNPNHFNNTISIYNLNSEISIRIQSDQNIIRINKPLKSGLYLIQLVNEQGNSTTKKFMVHHE